MKPSTEHWLLSTISKRLERIAEGKETMAEDRALTLLSILKDVAGDIPSLTSLPQHVKEWLEAAINARLDAIADKREIAAEDRIATLTEALAALRPPAAPGGSVESVDTGAGLSGGPITTTGTISLSTSSQQAIAKANTAVQPEDLADVATSGNYADLTNTPPIPEQFNPLQGTNMLITGTYPNITFSAVAGEEFTPVWGEIQGTLPDQTDLQNALDGKAPAVHQHNASDINAGTLANARISQGSVTQHQAALSIGWNQLSGLPAFATRWPIWNEVTGKPNIPQGTVTSVSAGNGMSFSTITGSGAVALGTPSTLSGSTTNSVTTSSHTHALSANLSAWDAVTPSEYAKREDSFLRAAVSNKTGPSSINIHDSSDLNEWTGAFFGYANSSVLNRPLLGNANVLGFGLSNYNVQIAMRDDRLNFRTQENSIWGDWNEVYHSGNFDPSAKQDALGFTPANAANSITAGNGLSGGGTLAATRTVTLGTPSNITLSSTNSVAASSHTHNFAPGGTTSQYIRGNGSLATFPSIPTSSDYVATSGNQTGLSGNKTWSGSHYFNAATVYVAGGTYGWMLDSRDGGIIGGLSGIGSTTVSLHGEGVGPVHISPNGRNATPRSTFNLDGSVVLGGHTTVNGTISASGNVTADGTVTATNLTATSDPRLKTNKQKTKARRELIEKLEYWSFEWKKDGTKGRSVMADKVLEIAPEHVHIGDDEDKTLAVDKGALALEMVFALIDMLKETDEETVHDVD